MPLLMYVRQGWAELVKQYEQGNVYLAECGQYLARMVNYEIPTVKHQITRNKQAIRVRVQYLQPASGHKQSP